MAAYNAPFNAPTHNPAVAPTHIARPVAPVDPFKPSVAFSVKNVWSPAGHDVEEDIDRPPPRAPQQWARLPANPAPFPDFSSQGNYPTWAPFPAGADPPQQPVWHSRPPVQHGPQNYGFEGALPTRPSPPVDARRRSDSPSPSRSRSQVRVGWSAPGRIVHPHHASHSTSPPFVRPAPVPHAYHFRDTSPSPHAVNGRRQRRSRSPPFGPPIGSVNGDIYTGYNGYPSQHSNTRPLEGERPHLQWDRIRQSSSRSRSPRGRSRVIERARSRSPTRPARQQSPVAVGSVVLSPVPVPTDSNADKSISSLSSSSPPQVHSPLQSSVSPELSVVSTPEEPQRTPPGTPPWHPYTTPAPPLIPSRHATYESSPWLRSGSDDSPLSPYSKLDFSSMPYNGMDRPFRFQQATFQPGFMPVIPTATYPSYSMKAMVSAFVVDTLPRQIYLHILLRLPSLYFSRVSRIFEEAEMSMPQIKQGILDAATKSRAPVGNIWEPASLQYGKLENTWQLFIDSLLREWKTFNIISVLLLSAILTILQIDSAANDPVTRFSALLSMICALMSLVYGCIYIIRFGTMRKTYKAAEWAHESQKSTTSIWWNVWVLLAMPATWLAWSLILYIVCIMSFIWRTGTIDDDDRQPLTANGAIGPRIAISAVLALGMIYFLLIASTLRRYGEMMDHAWQRRILGWMSDSLGGTYPTQPYPAQPYPTQRYPAQPYSTQPPAQPYSTQPYSAQTYPSGPISTPHWLSTLDTSTRPGVRSLSHGREKSRLTSSPTAFAFDGYGPPPERTSSDAPRGRSPHVRRSTNDMTVDALTADEKPEDGPTSVHSQEIKLHRLISNRVPNRPPWEAIAALGISEEDWVEISHDFTRIPDPWGDVTEAEAFLARWKPKFDALGGQIALCMEVGSAETDTKEETAVYYFSTTGSLPPERWRFGPIPQDTRSVEVRTSSDPDLLGLRTWRTITVLSSEGTSQPKVENS